MHSDREQTLPVLLPVKRKCRIWSSPDPEGESEPSHLLPILRSCPGGQTSRELHQPLQQNPGRKKGGWKKRKARETEVPSPTFHGDTSPLSGGNTNLPVQYKDCLMNFLFLWAKVPISQDAVTKTIGELKNK